MEVKMHRTNKEVNMSLAYLELTYG